MHPNSGIIFNAEKVDYLITSVWRNWEKITTIEFETMDGEKKYKMDGDKFREKVTLGTISYTGIKS